MSLLLALIPQVAGSISGSFATSTAAVNYTTLTIGGKSGQDWRVNTNTSPSNKEVKATGGGLISDWSDYQSAGGGIFDGGGTQGTAIEWTADGSPTSTGSETAGIRHDTFNDGSFAGFEWTVAAGTGERTARIDAPRYSDTGGVNRYILDCHLSDSSAADFQIALGGTSGSDVDGYFEITYKAASAGQNIRFRLYAQNNTGAGTFSTVNYKGCWVSTETVGGGVTGTLAVTTLDDTSAASGTTSVVAQSAITTSDDVATSNGTTTIIGAASVATIDDTSSATGTTSVVGTTSSTTGDDVSTATGSIGSAVDGSASLTTADDTVSANGTTIVIGTSSVTTLDDVSTASGTTSIVGQLALSTSDDVSAANGSPTVSGSLAVSTLDDTASASGSVGGAIDGNAAIATNDDTIAASGTTTVTGALSLSTADDVSSASGTTAIVGASSVLTSDDISAASGSAGALNGACNVTTGDDTCVAVGDSGQQQVGAGVSKRKTKRFYVDGDPYDVPIAEIEYFLSNLPDVEQENTQEELKKQKIVEIRAVSSNGLEVSTLSVADTSHFEAFKALIFKQIELPSFDFAQLEQFEADRQQKLLLLQALEQKAYQDYAKKYKARLLTLLLD